MTSVCVHLDGSLSASHFPGLPVLKLIQPCCYIFYTESQDAVPCHSLMTSDLWIVRRAPWTEAHLSLTVHGHAAWCSEDAFSPSGHRFLERMPPWYRSTRTIGRFLHLVNKLSKQEFINIWHLPSFSGFTWVTDAWWPLIIFVVAWNFSSGLMFVCSCQCSHRNRLSLGCFTLPRNHRVSQRESV